MAKGFQRLSNSGKQANAGSIPSPLTEAIKSLLNDVRANRTCDAIDRAIRKGMADGLFKPEHFENLHGPTNDKEASFAWFELTQRQRDIYRHSGPGIDRFLLEAWQIASWTGQAGSKTDPEFLHAARHACVDMAKVSIDKKARPIISPVPASDGMVSLAQPFDVHLVRFECKSQMADQVPGQMLEKVGGDPNSFDSCDQSYAHRTSPNVLLEWTHHSDHSDNNYAYSCHGVAYFCADPAKLDAFIDRRPDLGYRVDLFEKASRGSHSILAAVDNGFPVDLGSNWRADTQRLIHKVCSIPNEELLEGLLVRGASANRLAHEQTAPVYSLISLSARASESRVEKCLTSLVNHGLDLQANISTFNGVPPLHRAAEMDWANIAAKLMHIGCKPTDEDEDGKTPLSIAQNRGTVSDCAALFEAWMAKNQIQQIIASVAPKP